MQMVNRKALRKIKAHAHMVDYLHFLFILT